MALFGSSVSVLKAIVCVKSCCKMVFKKCFCSLLNLLNWEFGYELNSDLICLKWYVWRWNSKKSVRVKNSLCFRSIQHKLSQIQQRVTIFCACYCFSYDAILGFYQSFHCWSFYLRQLLRE